MQSLIPFFCHDFQILHLHALGWPQQRSRGWLRGLRRDCIEMGKGVPPALPSIGAEFSLESVLQTYVKTDDFDNFTKNQKANLDFFMDIIKKDLRSGKAGRVA